MWLWNRVRLFAELLLSSFRDAICSPVCNPATPDQASVESEAFNVYGPLVMHSKSVTMGVPGAMYGEEGRADA
jgi:hypothetical protein